MTTGKPARARCVTLGSYSATAVTYNPACRDSGTHHKTRAPNPKRGFAADCLTPRQRSGCLYLLVPSRSLALASVVVH
jgi:hypothetical protein